MQVRSLHIGSREFFDPRYGPGLLNTVSCADDARRFAEVALARRFESVDQLVGVAATVASVKASIERSAAELSAGDYFILTFSGHGLAVYVNDRLIVTWCFFDDDLRRDELATLLARFNPGVRILVVANCCYSSAGIEPVEGERLLTLLPEDVMITAHKYISLAEDGGDVLRFYDGAVEPWNAALAFFENSAAHIIEIASCGPKERAVDGNDPWNPTPFVAELLQEIRGDHYIGLQGFMDDLTVRCTARTLPSPRHRAYAPRDAAFEGLGPFRS